MTTEPGLRPKTPARPPLAMLETKAAQICQIALPPMKALTTATLSMARR